MEQKSQENTVAIENSELKNSRIDNSETGTVNNNETGTVNNYYNSLPQPPTPTNLPQLQAQLDRIENKLDFLIQRVFSELILKNHLTIIK